MKLISALAFIAVTHGLALPSTGLERRAVVAHDSLYPLSESVRSGTEGTAIRRFEPLLWVSHGCQPYTAVDSSGNTSGGLNNSGGATAGCTASDRGQTYVRAAWHNGRFAIMYAWYWPKDQPNDGANLGHRHDWENVVVWVNDPALASPTLIGAAASTHGDYRINTTPPRNGNRPYVEYFRNGLNTHELRFESGSGRDYAMIDWNNLTPAARSALEQTDFGNANVPFKDGTFVNNLNEAWI